MALEVAQADEHVRVHHGAANLGLLHVFTAHHGHLHIVGALQAVADDDLAAGGEGGEAVLIGGLNVLQRVFAAAGVQGVAVGEEGHAAALLHQVGHHLGVVGPQERQVARLAKVHLDGNKFAVQIHAGQAGAAQQTGELFRHTGAGLGTEIREKHLRGHVDSPFILGMDMGGIGRNPIVGGRLPQSRRLPLREAGGGSRRMRGHLTFAASTRQ